MKTIIMWIRWAIFIIPYTLCWWITYVVGWLTYGRERPYEPLIVKEEIVSSGVILRSVPLRMRG